MLTLEPAVEYVFRNYRVASAHAFKDYPFDADMSSETHRLSVAAEVMCALARYFIRTNFQFSDSYFNDEQDL